jgi:hypothetical protein
MFRQFILVLCSVLSMYLVARGKIVACNSQTRSKINLARYKVVILPIIGYEWDF